MHDRAGPQGRTLHSRVLVEEFLARELSRRAIVKGALAGSALWLAGCKSSSTPGPGAQADAAGGGRSDAGGAAPDASPDIGNAPAGHLVGMGWSDTDRTAAFEAALAETVGLSFIRRGDTVYFRVNSNNWDRYPHSTNPDLIVEMAQRCRDLGASRIIVGDRSFWGDTGTRSNMQQNGIADAARTAGADLVVFDDGEVDWVQITEQDAPNWAGGFRLPRPVVDADHILNLPCLKTHFIAHYSLSMKIMFGLVHPDDRARTGNLDVHVTSRLWRQISQVNQHVTPTINIIDGTRALISGGPNVDNGPTSNPATYGDPKVFIVSTDRVATDVTGIAVLQTLSPPSEQVTRRHAWRSLQIQQAVRDRIGITGPEQYDLSGPTVPMIETYRMNAVAS